MFKFSEIRFKLVAVLLDVPVLNISFYYIIC